MGIHRSSTVLWPTGTSVAANDTSQFAATPGDQVMLYIDNEGANSHTFRIQVGRGGQGAGRNVGSNIVWYEVQEDDLSASVEIVVAANENKAFDLSPFGGSFLRLLCTVGTASNIAAYVESSGPS